MKVLGDLASHDEINISEVKTCVDEICNIPFMGWNVII
jgi:hypothetical protein